MREGEYSHITYDTTVALAFAIELLRLNPIIVFNFVSGSPTDSSERGKVMWVRVKGKTENINAVLKDYPKQILEVNDIVKLSS